MVSKINNSIFYLFVYLILFYAIEKYDYKNWLDKWENLYNRIDI